MLLSDYEKYFQIDKEFEEYLNDNNIPIPNKYHF